MAGLKGVQVPDDHTETQVAGYHFVEFVGVGNVSDLVVVASETLHACLFDGSVEAVDCRGRAPEQEIFFLDN